MNYKIEDIIVKLVPYKINDKLRGKDIKSPYGVDMIKAKSIWTEAKKGEGIKIAVIDSGCDINHDSIKDNIIGVRNFTDEDRKNQNIVIDRVGHGTHVIGTIAAKGQNNTVVGVAPNVGIYVLKAIDRTGSGKLSWVVNAINYAVKLKVDIISMSLGMSQSNDKLERAIKEAINKDILVVCAAGNDGDGNSESFEYSYPAAYPDVISVGAVDKNGVPASFSNSNLAIDLLAPGVNILSTFPNNQFAILSGTVISVGAVDKNGVPASFSNSNLAIDLLAPGVNILSTFPNNQFAILSGTSMAAPHVSGSLALLKNWSYKEFQRNLSQRELYAQLIKHTKLLDYSRTTQGNGLVCLEEYKIKKKIKY